VTPVGGTSQNLAWDPLFRVSVLVELDTLDERSGAVADADDGYPNRTHDEFSFC
jgi:hypothetical protein